MKEANTKKYYKNKNKIRTVIRKKKKKEKNIDETDEKVEAYEQ